MTQVIVWKQDNGVAAIFYPTQEAIDSFGMEEIAKRVVPGPKTIFDIPTGKFEVDPATMTTVEIMEGREKVYPYKILDAEQIPKDRSMRNAWTIDDEDLTDGIGGQ